MDKERILQLVDKRISGTASFEELYELQNLLQKNIGVSDAHKILLHLHNIESLISASETLRQQKQRRPLTASGSKEKTRTAGKTISRNCLTPHFFIRNNLFQIYCALTLRQLNRILY